MVAYPEELPLDAVAVLLGYVRGKVPAVGVAAHAAWNIIGYGLDRGLPIGIEPFGAASEEDDTEALESLLGDGPPQGVLLSVAIGVAIKIALRVLKEIIA